MRSTERAARCAAPTADTEAVPSFVGAGHWPARGRGLPLPYRSPESPSSMGRECPWASRQDAPQKMAGGREGRPYICLKSDGRVRTPAPTAGTEAVPSFRRGRTLAGPQMYAARPGGRALRLSTSRHLLGKARRGRENAPAEILGRLGPGGPEKKRKSPLRFCAPVILNIFPGTRPP